MSHPGTIRFGSILHRILVYGGCGFGLLLLVALIVAWYRGKVQEARVAALLAVAEDASIEAEFGPFQYRPRPVMGSLILGRGQRLSGFGVVGDPPPYLERLISIVGEHCFARVTDIHVNSEKFSDADIDLLLAFPDLRAIDLSSTAITDVGFNRLISKVRLVEFNVSGTNISAEAMRRLANYPELKEIGLSDPAHEEAVEAELQRALPECLIR